MGPIPPSLYSNVPPSVVDTNTPYPSRAYQRSVADVLAEIATGAAGGSAVPMTPPEASPGAGAGLGGGMPQAGAPGQVPPLSYQAPQLPTEQEFVQTYFPQLTQQPVLQPGQLKIIQDAYQSFIATKMAMARGQESGDRLMLGRESLLERQRENDQDAQRMGRYGRGAQMTPEQTLKALVMHDAISGQDSGAGSAWQRYDSMINPTRKKPDAKQVIEDALIAQAGKMFPDDPMKQAKYINDTMAAWKATGEGSSESRLMTPSAVSEIVSGKPNQLEDNERQGGLVQVMRQNGPIGGYLAGLAKVEQYGPAMTPAQKAQLENMLESRRPSAADLAEAVRSGWFKDPKNLELLVQLGILTEEELTTALNDAWYKPADYGAAGDLAARKVIEKILPPEQLERVKARVGAK